MEEEKKQEIQSTCIFLLGTVGMTKTELERQVPDVFVAFDDEDDISSMENWIYKCRELGLAIIGICDGMTKILEEEKDG